MASPEKQLSDAVTRYESDDNLGVLIDTLRDVAKRSDPDALVSAVDSYRDRPEVVMPLYEHIVALRPNDARALVTLANAYWITGRGPDIVGELATRAKAADPANRAAWHLWALAESNVRERVDRWKQVATKELDATKGMLQGKLKLKGDLPTIVRYTKASQEMTECTTRVPVEWPDEN